MKKIVTTIAALAMAVSMFAVDFSANVRVKGDVAYGKSVDGTNSFSLLGVENTEQKDNDLLEINFNGDKAGAFVRFWTTAKAETLKVRALKLWFQPVDGVKINLGNSDLELYKERVNWWKVPCGASISDFNSWNGRWASGAGVHENFGATIEITAIDGLYLGLGAEDSFFSKTGDADATVKQWGAVAKYTISDIGMSVGAAWRNTANWKLLTVGADYQKDAFYGFVQGKLRFEGAKDAKLGGVTIDNYLEYSINGIKLQGTFPVTIRGLLDNAPETDGSYMTARAKVTIPVDAFNVYVVLGSNEGQNNGPADLAGKAIWTFDNFGDNFNFYGNVGATFNVGACALDLGVEVGYDKPSKTFAWAIPFTTLVSF